MTNYRMRGTGSGDEQRMMHPNAIVYRKMESVVSEMLNGEDAVPIKTVKSFLTKIPSVFTGQDIVAWLLRNKDIVDLGDALHLAHLLATHGYVFQIDDHVLTVKNDGTYYRFQTPYFWPSNCWDPENTDYAVYLCKRTMQNKAHLELEDFEAENLAKLQKMFSRKWEFVFMQAEAQYKVDKKRDRLERQILDSQERAFWDVHRPVPGCVNTTEVDFRKLSRSGRPKYSASNSSLLNTTGNAEGGCGGLSSQAAQSAAAITVTPSNMHAPSSSGGIAVGDSPQGSGDSDKPPSDQPQRELPTNVPSTSNNNNNNNSTYNAAAAQRDQHKKYYQRPGLRRCTQVQDTLKYEVGWEDHSLLYFFTEGSRTVKIGTLQSRLAKNVIRTSKVVENYLQYYERRKPFDVFLTPPGGTSDTFAGQPNPWISDTIDFWSHDKITGDPSTRRLKLWEESFEELLSDQIGRETLQRFLDKEYSGENLRFWWEVQKLRSCSCRMVPVHVTEIYNEFIDANATSPVNIDCKVMETTEENLTNPNRWSFDEAAEHIFCLMKNDSYQRFLRSEIYRDLLSLSRKKSSFSALIARKTSRKVPGSSIGRSIPRPQASTSSSHNLAGSASPLSVQPNHSGGNVAGSPNSLAIGSAEMPSFLSATGRSGSFAGSVISTATTSLAEQSRKILSRCHDSVESESPVTLPATNKLPFPRSSRRKESTPTPLVDAERPRVVAMSLKRRDLSADQNFPQSPITAAVSHPHLGTMTEGDDGQVPLQPQVTGSACSLAVELAARCQYNRVFQTIKLMRETIGLGRFPNFVSQQISSLGGGGSGGSGSSNVPSTSIANKRDSNTNVTSSTTTTASSSVGLQSLSQADATSPHRANKLGSPTQSPRDSRTAHENADNDQSTLSVATTATTGLSWGLEHE